MNRHIILNWGPGARDAFEAVREAGHTTLEFEQLPDLEFPPTYGRSACAGARVTGILAHEERARFMAARHPEKQLHVWCRWSNRGLQQWAQEMYPRVVVWQEESPDVGGSIFTDFSKLRYGLAAYWKASGERVTGYRMP